MKVLEIMDMPASVTPGSEYSAITYPGEGAYLSPSGMLFVVSGGVVFSISGASPLIKETVSAAVSAAASVSESFALRALAIAHNPELAKELTQ